MHNSDLGYECSRVRKKIERILDYEEKLCLFLYSDLNLFFRLNFSLFLDTKKRFSTNRFTVCVNHLYTRQFINTAFFV